VERSLAAFAAAADRATLGEAVVAPRPVPAALPKGPLGPQGLLSGWQALADRVAALPPPVAELAGPGLRKVVDFQDLAYGTEYLDRVAAVLARDDAGRGFELTREAAKYIANAMAYDDVIRVADLKTRATRADRIRAEMGAGGGNLLQVTEYLHPRAEEIVGMLPAGFGARVAANPVWMARIDRWFGRGRHLRSDGLVPFLGLYLVGGLRGWRRRSLRHAQEVAHLDRWLAAAMAHLPDDYALACEVLRCRRLIKGYSDTHARGLSKFDRVMAGIALVQGREDAADWARRLREAALKDEEGRALDGALQTIRSFAAPGAAAD
jgi:indolepyruvate ferredoxin oxidoreductase beta subunit